MKNSKSNHKISGTAFRPHDAIILDMRIDRRVGNTALDLSDAILHLYFMEHRIVGTRLLQF